MTRLFNNKIPAANCYILRLVAVDGFGMRNDDSFFGQQWLTDPSEGVMKIPL